MAIKSDAALVVGVSLGILDAVGINEAVGFVVGEIKGNMLGDVLGLRLGTVVGDEDMVGMEVIVGDDVEHPFPNKLEASEESNVPPSATRMPS